MAFKDTIKKMKDLLVQIATDVEKAVGGNKAASQRVRTGTVKLEKVGKQYRKESIVAEKKMKGKSKPKKKPVAKKKPVKKIVKKIVKKLVKKVVSKPIKKVVHNKKTPIKKKATAKLPVKKKVGKKK